MSAYSVRATSDETLRHLPGDDRRVVPAGYFVMERKQLLGIARRAECAAAVPRPALVL